MTRAEAVVFFRGEQKYYKAFMQPKASEACKLAADALEAVERLESERDQWQSIGAEEELRRLASTHSFRMLGRDDLIDRADKIKARRRDPRLDPRPGDELEFVTPEWNKERMRVVGTGEDMVRYQQKQLAVANGKWSGSSCDLARWRDWMAGSRVIHASD